MSDFTHTHGTAHENLAEAIAEAIAEVREHASKASTLANDSYLKLSEMGDTWDYDERVELLHESANYATLAGDQAHSALGESVGLLDHLGSLGVRDALVKALFAGQDALHALDQARAAGFELLEVR